MRRITAGQQVAALSKVPAPTSVFAENSHAGPWHRGAFALRWFVAGAFTGWNRCSGLLRALHKKRNQTTPCRTYAILGVERRHPLPRRTGGRMAANVGPGTIRLIVSRFAMTAV